MKDDRFKNKDWALPVAESGKIATWDAVKIAVLMDIRDELQKMNALLHCPNFVGIPQTLKRIDRRLTRTRKLKKGVR